LNRTKHSRSREEWGYFIHLDERGHLIAGELKKGPSDEWITLEAYLKARKQDKTIQGLMHTHPKSERHPGSELVFSVGNVGVFLEANDAVQICMDPQGDYLIMLRTEQTDRPREGISKEAAKAYVDLAQDISNTHIIEHNMEIKDAIVKSVFDALIEICTNYKIALYKGGKNKAPKKVA